MISMSAVTLMLALQLFRSWNERDNAFLFIYAAAALLFCLVVLAATLYRTFKKPTEIVLDRLELRLNGRTIHANEISVIMKRGYFRPVIGIKPYGNYFVPLQLCFRFSEDEDKGMADMVKWAAANDVKLVHKSFQTWI
ncbi:hypothetical protein [Paenibacillus sacheonensis]|uniref:Uncharacterized protein n=2 Tax=Paenibacillus sacheonensis TaxID=742054 RepID=A0A7X5BWQ5_9BACL|nr:hypothetical protein [Paenibacillus sacheonensis]NBC67772.1 hypothetical protein [Paenibacillus sacheonensis]